MKGMRNRLVHGYDRVDVEKVRLAVEESVPRLVPQLEQLVTLLRQAGAVT